MRHDEHSYDVVVVGGGLAGYCAAIAAARGGASTCLIQDRPVLGGNSSSEIRVTPHGAGRHHPYAAETGIVAEVLLAERAACHVEAMENAWTNSQWDLALYDLACRTPGLNLQLNSSCDDVILADGTHGHQLDPDDIHVDESRGYRLRPAINPARRIAAVSVTVLGAETRLTVRGSQFIDCTGDGLVAHLAGCEWRLGSEAQNEFGEVHAPSVANALTMGNSIQFLCRDVGWPVPYRAPPWAKRYDHADFFWGSGGRMPHNPRGGFWWLEIGVPYHVVHDNEDIRHELTAHTLGVWDWMKNRDAWMKEACATYVLDWIGQVPGKRESRRIMGQHLCNENELHMHQHFADEIAHGGWYLDLHTPGGLLAEHSEPMSAQGYGNTIERSKGHVGPYGIPLRSLISKDIDNLGMAGRNISCTKAALGSIRVMSTCAMLGQAIGTAAARAHASGKDLANHDDNDVRHVQQRLLREGVFLPHGEHHDDDDLIRSARLSASSSRLNPGVLSDRLSSERCTPAEQPQQEGLAQLLVVAADRLEQLELCLSCDWPSPRPAHLRLRRVASIWDYAGDAGELLAETTIMVPPGQHHWLPWQLALDLTSGGYLRLEMDPDPKARINWTFAEHMSPAQPAMYLLACGRRYIRQRKKNGSSLCCRLFPAQAVWEPEQIHEPSNRPYRHTSCWRAADDDACPSLSARWDRPQRIAQVEIQFAADLAGELSVAPPLSINPGIASAYRIQALIDGDWRDQLCITGNVQQQRIHQLPTAIDSQGLRVVIDQAEAAGIACLRAYATIGSYPDPWANVASD
jgi:hypothetical protein